MNERVTIIAVDACVPISFIADISCTVAGNWHFNVVLTKRVTNQTNKQYFIFLKFVIVVCITALPY
jgi:hypothetical protein